MKIKVLMSMYSGSNFLPSDPQCSLSSYIYTWNFKLDLAKGLNKIKLTPISIRRLCNQS
jgi:hypothetical protein